MQVRYWLYGDILFSDIEEYITKTEGSINNKSIVKLTGIVDNTSKSINASIVVVLHVASKKISIEINQIYPNHEKIVIERDAIFNILDMSSLDKTSELACSDSDLADMIRQIESDS